MKRVAKPAAAAVTTPEPGGQVRVELKCARCEPCVLVVTVLGDPDDPTKPDLDKLTLLVHQAGWTVNKAKQPICPDCR